MPDELDIAVPAVELAALKHRATGPPWILALSEDMRGTHSRDLAAIMTKSGIDPMDGEDAS